MEGCRMTRRLVGLLVAGALVVAACGSNSVGSQVDNPDDRPVDLAAFGLSRDDERVLHNAEQEYVRRCAAAAGFQFVPTPYEAIENGKDAAASKAWPAFGSDDVEAASVEGYRFQDRVADSQSPDPEASNQAILEGLSPDQQEQWSLAVSGDSADMVEVSVEGGVVGTPRSGCISEVRRILYGDLATYMELTSLSIDLNTRVRNAAEADPTFVSAEAAWSSCMGNQGWDVAAQSDALLLSLIHISE